MSVVPSLYEGMQGKKDATVRIPSTGLSTVMLTNRSPDLGLVLGRPVKGQGTLNPTNDYSSRRGVLSCNPINEFVLRQAPGNATNGMQAPVGIGTNEPKGLQSMPEYPNNYPVMRPTNNFGMVM